MRERGCVERQKKGSARGQTKDVSTQVFVRAKKKGSENKEKGFREQRKRVQRTKKKGSEKREQRAHPVEGIKKGQRVQRNKESGYE